MSLSNRAKVKLFYVLYLPEGETREYIDLIRYLANPSERWPSHITVRGPYQHALSRRRLLEYQRMLHGNIVDVRGLDAFVGPSQYTVFLQCDATALRRVWLKSDYGYRPHLTLYDGRDHYAARQFEEVAQQYDLRWRFPAEDLQLLVGSRQWREARGQQRIDLMMRFRPEFFRFKRTRHLTGADAAQLRWEERLVLIDRLFARLERAIRVPAR